MEGGKRKGYAWAISAGFSADLAAISAKLSMFQFGRYGLVLLFSVTMWACYVNSLKALSSLQATATNFATNFITSGLAGFFLFEEPLSFQNKQSMALLLCLFFLTFIALDHQSIKRFTVSTLLISAVWFAGALLIVVGVIVLSKSSIEEKVRTD